MEQCCRSNARAEEEMMRKHVLEKKRLPKSLRDEMKARSLMFKESLRIAPGALNAEQEREKIRQVSNSNQQQI
jgi:STE20-like kinase